MALTTTTVAAIVTKTISVIKALSPGQPSDVAFDHVPYDHDLLSWSLANLSPALRRFEVVDAGPRVEPGQWDSAGFLATRVLSISVAYPTKGRAVYGDTRLVGLRDMADADATLIRDALMSWSNVANGGHHGTRVTVQPLDRGRVEIWIQRLDATVFYNQAQTLT